MTEQEVHLLLSDVKIDNDNLDYIKLTGEICGKLRWDLVNLFAIPVAIAIPSVGVSVAGCPYRVQDSCNFKGMHCLDETCNIKAKPITDC